MDNDLFADLRIRDAWVVKGLIRTFVANQPQKKRPTRNSPFPGLVLTAAIGASAFIGTEVPLPNTPAQAAMVWPSGPTVESTRRLLRESLSSIKGLKLHPSSDRIEAAVLPRSIHAAENLLPQLPDTAGSALAGINGDGNVYFRMARGRATAYLTIEEKSLHLLVMEDGKDNVYIDDQKYNGKKLPAEIAAILKKSLA